MVSRRFACLFLAVSMTLSSIWIVSADQSHQIKDSAEAAASYSAAVQALEEAGLSQSAQANSNIAIDLGMLEQEETVDLSQLAVQAVQLQQEEEARQAEAARQTNREAARRTGRQAARQALLDAYDGAMAARQITVYAAPSDSAASLRTLRQGKVARLNDVTEDGNWYQITFSGTTGYVRADGCQTVQYSDYAGTSAVKSAREDLVDYAKSFLGTRYVWGGASPSGFDCSGFTMYVYAHFGYRMSHGASDQLYAFTRVSTAERLAGDLVFFSYGGGDISHVGIYLGGGAFIHATSNGGVKISYFDGYYSSTYVGAVRILADCQRFTLSSPLCFSAQRSHAARRTIFSAGFHRIRLPYFRFCARFKDKNTYFGDEGLTFPHFPPIMKELTISLHKEAMRRGRHQPQHRYDHRLHLEAHGQLRSAGLFGQSLPAAVQHGGQRHRGQICGQAGSGRCGQQRQPHFYDDRLFYGPVHRGRHRHRPVFRGQEL